MKLKNLYKKLLKEYGYQGWWPLLNNGYHPKDYEPPLTRNEVFEISVGAILTQNTNWNNVQKALTNLNKKKLLNPEKLIKTNIKLLKECVKPAGYYNQKADYLKNFTKFFQSLNKTPSRDELLSIKGIGDETADSILLYAYKVPTFVVDAYTKRLFPELGDNYNKVKKFFEDNLPKDYKLFQEFHALIVEHAKKMFSSSSLF